MIRRWKVCENSSLRMRSYNACLEPDDNGKVNLTKEDANDRILHMALWTTIPGDNYIMLNNI